MSMRTHIVSQHTSPSPSPRPRWACTRCSGTGCRPARRGARGPTAAAGGRMQQRRLQRRCRCRRRRTCWPCSLLQAAAAPSRCAARRGRPPPGPGCSSRTGWRAGTRSALGVFSRPGRVGMEQNARRCRTATRRIGCNDTKALTVLFRFCRGTCTCEGDRKSSHRCRYS